MGRVADRNHAPGVPSRHPDVPVRREDELPEVRERVEQLARLGTKLGQLFLEGVDPASPHRIQLPARDPPVQAATPTADWEDSEQGPRAPTDLVQPVATGGARARDPQGPVIIWQDTVRQTGERADRGPRPVRGDDDVEWPVFGPVAIRQASPILLTRETGHLAT